MPVIFNPSLLKGYIELPPDEQMLMKLFICAAFSDAETKIEISGGMPKTLQMTADCLNMLGAASRVHNDTAYISPVSGHRRKEAILQFGQSADAFDLLMAPAIFLSDSVKLEGDRCIRRPTAAQIGLLRTKGFAFDAETLPITISGNFIPGAYRIDAALPKAFISGLMMVLPLAGGESRLILDNAHVETTLSVMKKFSVTATKTNYGFLLGPQDYISPMTVFSEANWLTACYFILANALGSDIKCVNLNSASMQPERKISNMLAAVLTGGASEVDCSDFPDCMPLLCIAACAVKRTVMLICRAHCAAEMVTQSLSVLGAHITSAGNALTVEGHGMLDGGTTVCHGSRHLAMSLAIASILCRQPLTIQDYSPAADSVFDAFLDSLIKLGGKIDIV